MFDQKSLEEAAKHPPLGPAYFEARAIVERQMAKFEAEQFEPLIKKFTDAFREKLWDDVRDHMFESDLLGKEKLTQNVQVGLGVTAFF